MSIVSFPEISDFNTDSVTGPSIYIGAAGFEDRSLAVLKKIKENRKTLSHIVGIEYQPYYCKNNKDGFEHLASELVPSNDNIKWIKFDRENPGQLDASLKSIREICAQFSHIWLDISAMSKLLILVLLEALRDIDVSLTIAYAEAEVYHPDRKEFEGKIKQVKRTMQTLEFLTSGVAGVVTTSALSSIAMQNYPTALVAFPTFNSQLLSALLTEVTPQDLIIVEGEPLRDLNKWRQTAIRKLNQEFYASAKATYVASTFYYDKTIKLLEKICQDYRFTHELVVAPANSKLQTVGVFFFKQMHPEIQILYPTPKSFIFNHYTERVKQIHQISFHSYCRFVHSLDGHRYMPLAELGAALSLRTLKPRQLALLQLLAKLSHKGLQVNEPTLQRLIYANDRRLSRTNKMRPLYGQFIRTQFGPFNNDLFADINQLREEGLIQLDGCMLTLTNRGQRLLEQNRNRGTLASKAYFTTSSTRLSQVYPLKPMLKVEIGSVLP